MSETRRYYTKEFKLMAVELSNTREDIPALAEELNVRAELIYRWRRELSETKESSFPGNGVSKLSPEQAEIIKLKKELREAQLERDILKKAVSIFSKSDGKNSDS